MSEVFTELSLLSLLTPPEASVAPFLLHKLPGPFNPGNGRDSISALEGRSSQSRGSGQKRKKCCVLTFFFKG